MRKFIFAFFTLIISTTAMCASVESPCSEIVGAGTQYECKNTFRCYWDTTENACIDCPNNEYPNSNHTECVTKSVACDAYDNNASQCKNHGCYYNNTYHSCMSASDMHYCSGDNCYFQCATNTGADDKIAIDGYKGLHMNPPENSIYTYFYSGMEHMCQWKAKCPPGTEYKYYFNGYTYTNSCEQCLKDTYSDGKGVISYNQAYNYQVAATCKYCGEGQTVNADQTGCIDTECGRGQYFDTTEKQCRICSGNTIKPNRTGECVECPQNSTASADHTYCVCNTNYFYFDYDESSVGISSEEDVNEIINGSGGLYDFAYERFKTTKAGPESSCTKDPYLVMFYIATPRGEIDHFVETPEYLCGPGYYWPGPEDENDMRLWCYKQCEEGYYCEGYGYFDADAETDEGYPHLQENLHRQKCDDGTTSDPGATSEDDCYPICEAGYYLQGTTCQRCQPEDYTSDPGATSEDDCYQICTAGLYATFDNNSGKRNRECSPCPAHFTSDAKTEAKSIKDCYMDPNTKFCDNNNNCQTLADIFGTNVKIDYKEQ